MVLAYSSLFQGKLFVKLNPMHSLGRQNLNAVTRPISFLELLLALSLENVLQSNARR